MFRTSHILKAAALTAVMLGAATSAFAQGSSVNAQQAMAAMNAMQTYAKNDGSNPSITVIDRDGNIVLQLAGDNSSPHNLGLSARKAITSNMFKMPSIEWRDKTMPGKPDADQRMMPNAIPLGGGYPITVGNDVIGAVGVSGTRGGQEGDTAAAKAAAEAAAALVQRLQAQN